MTLVSFLATRLAGEVDRLNTLTRELECSMIFMWSICLVLAWREEESKSLLKLLVASKWRISESVVSF